MICVLIHSTTQLRQHHNPTMPTTCSIQNSAIFSFIVLRIFFYLNQKNIVVPIFAMMHFNSITRSFPSRRCCVNAFKRATCHPKWLNNTNINEKSRRNMNDRNIVLKQVRCGVWVWWAVSGESEWGGCSGKYLSRKINNKSNEPSNA